MQLYHYKWVHLATGETGRRSLECEGPQVFLGILQIWNDDPANIGWLYAPINGSAAHFFVNHTANNFLHYRMLAYRGE